MRHMIFILTLFASGLQAQESKPQKDELQDKRIVALAPHIVESLYDIGAGDQIIATTEHSDYPEAAKNIPRIGNYARLQIERIVQLAPDVIIAWQTGNPQDDLDRLKNYGLNIVYSNPTTLASVADELLMLGEITGRTTAAQQIARQFSQRLEALESKYSNARPVTGFYEMWARPLRTVANKAWLQQQLVVCGVKNPFASLSEDYPLIGLEQVLASKPQIVLQPTPHSPQNTDALNWQQWPEIPASKHGFIFHPDADKTHRMTLRMLDEVEILCRQVDKARDFYLAH